MCFFSWLGQKIKDRRLVVSLNSSKRSEFEDAVSLTTSGSKSLHFTSYSGKCHRHSKVSETILKQCIEITD